MSATVRHVHMRELGYCNRGARVWFSRHGLSWSDFLANGIDGDTLRATGDAMAARVADHAAENNQGAERGQQ